MHESSSPRRRWWIALLFALAPGTGWLYAGRPATFLANLAAMLACNATAMFGGSFLATPRGLIALSAANLAALGAACFGPPAACLLRRAERPRWRWRRASYAAAAAAFWASSLAPGLVGIEPAAKSFVASSGSMAPGLEPGDAFLADLDAARRAAIRPGDVVVFRVPGGEEILVGRVVATQGSRVRLVDGTPEIDGSPVPEAFVGATEIRWSGRAQPAELRRATLPNGRSHLVTRDPRNAPAWNTPETTLGPDEFYVLGDNRENSRDSREPHPTGLGPIRREAVIGVVTGIYWSADLGRIGLRLDD